MSLLQKIFQVPRMTCFRFFNTLNKKCKYKKTSPILSSSSNSCFIYILHQQFRISFVKTIFRQKQLTLVLSYFY